MRIYRAIKDIEEPGVSNPSEILIYNGQMFFIDSVVDLPYYDEKTVNEYWQELGLNNNYGTIQLTNQRRN